MSNRYPTQDELRRSYQMRSTWGVTTAIAALLVIAGFVLTPLLSKYLVMSARFAIVIYISTIAAFFVLAIAAHNWSVHVVSRLYLQVREDRREPDEDNLGNEGCYYCGHDQAPIICGSCGSIQWPGLAHRATGILDTRANWAVGVFVAHHRFKLLAAGLSVLFLGFLPSIVQIEGQRNQQERERLAREQSLLADLGNETLGDVMGFRVALLNLQNVCLNDGTLDISLASGGYNCADEYKDFTKNYFAFSWRGPQIMARARRDHCAQPQVPLQKKSCKLLDLDLIDTLDDQFIAFIETESKDDLVERYGLCEARARAAHDLWFTSRRVSCALVLAASPIFGYQASDRDYPPSNKGCFKELSRIVDKPNLEGDDYWAERSGVQGGILRESGPDWLSTCRGSGNEGTI